MLAKELLLKLKFCRGIGIHGENKIYQWILTNHQLERVHLSSQDIIKIAKLNKKQSLAFQSDYNSLKIKQRMEYNTQRLHWISILDENYPRPLAESYLPPNVLFYLGDIKLLEKRLLGVVGARKNSKYSFVALKNILPPIINQDIGIVSGLAEGVDGLSHQCVLANNGFTIAVIGTGLDRYYPIHHQKLQQIIAKEQLLISEYPLGTTAAKHHFPERNRIIAGLSEAVMVVEAKHHSGSLITANLALQNNRNVVAIPGRIDSLLSKGCNELIKAGAKPILTANDLLEEFNDFII